MHNYSVPSKYNHITRIGNWSEEWELEQTKLKDYLKAKETGTLSSIKREGNLQLGLQPVELSSSTNGQIRFGDKIMLYSYQTEGIMASDVTEKLGQFDESFPVTTAKGLYPCVRSVFTIQRYEKEKELFDGDIIHYGQKFRLQAQSEIYKKNLYLGSLAANPMRCAKYSRFNEVHITHKDNIDTVWSFDFHDSKQRFEQQNQPVSINDPVLIRHVLTSQWLGSDIINYPNQYGVEYEVFGHTQLTHNKTQILGSEKGGKTTIDIPCRNQRSINHFHIIVKDNSTENRQ